MFPMYYEGILTGSVIFKMALFIQTRFINSGYTFRKTMILLFIGIYTLGRVYEMFNISAYHEEQSQAIAAMVCAVVTYAIARIINEMSVGVSMRKVLYWIAVGDLKTDVKKCT
jgi:putative Mn2+ efflux pump MntP